MEQNMAHLLAEIRTNREERGADQELLKEEILAKMETNQERMNAKSDAHHEKMMDWMDSQLEKMETTVDVFEERLNKMNTTDLEANREKLGAVGEQQNVPKRPGRWRLSEHWWTDMGNGI
jgi:hypothetical protein